MAAPFASLQQLNSRRDAHRSKSSPPQVAPSYAYHDFHEHPTPCSYQSFQSYAIPASSGSSQSWQYQQQQPICYHSPPYPSPPQQPHLFQPLPMPVPPRYSEHYPPPHYNIGQGHAAPTPYYTYLPPSASAGWSDPGLRAFAAALDERAVPVTRDRPSEYDLSRRRVWDSYDRFEEPPSRRKEEEVFLPYGEFDPRTGQWRAPSSPEKHRSHHDQSPNPYQFWAYPVAAAAPYPAYHASQHTPPQTKQASPTRTQIQPIVIPPPAERPVIPIPPSWSYSSTSSAPPRRNCFLARLFGGGKKPGMARLPDPQKRDVFFDRSPQSSSSASSTIANFGSHPGGMADFGKEKRAVRWRESVEEW